MSKLNIKLKVSPITQLAQEVNGKYSFVLQFTKPDGSTLNSENIANEVTISVDTFWEDGVDKMILSSDIKDGDYSMPLSIKIFNKDKQKLLVSFDNYRLISGSGESYLPVPVVGVRDGKRIYNVGEWWYEVVNSKHVWFEILPTGFVRVHEPDNQKTFNGKHNVNQLVLGDLWEDMEEDTPDQLAALRSPEGIDLPPFETLTYMGYPVREDWGKSLQQVKDSAPGGINIWYAYGNNDASNQSTYFRNNSGEPHQASVYKYKLS